MKNIDVIRAMCRAAVDLVGNEAYVASLLQRIIDTGIGGAKFVDLLNGKDIALDSPGAQVVAVVEKPGMPARRTVVRPDEEEEGDYHVVPPSMTERLIDSYTPDMLVGARSLIGPAAIMSPRMVYYIVTQGKLAEWYRAGGRQLIYLSAFVKAVVAQYCPDELKYLDHAEAAFVKFATSTGAGLQNYKAVKAYVINNFAGPEEKLILAFIRTAFVEMNK